jgi:hypothetical protein
VTYSDQKDSAEGFTGRQVAQVEVEARTCSTFRYAGGGETHRARSGAPVPDGKGHHGLEAIAAFFDTVIAPNDLITFEIENSYLCGNEVADVGAIRTVLPGGKHVAVVHGVYTYRCNDAGQLVALRAFWEFDKAELIET